MAIKSYHISIPPRIRRRETERRKYIIQKRLKSILIAIICIAGLWYVLGGDVGLIATAQLKVKEKKLRRKLEILKAQSDSLDNVIWKLENDTLFIEQMARKKLGMVKGKEKMFIFKTTENR